MNVRVILSGETLWDYTNALNICENNEGTQYCQLNSGSELLIEATRLAGAVVGAVDGRAETVDAAGCDAKSSDDAREILRTTGMSERC